MSIRKVWAVTTGEYSDYNVKFLATTRKVADAYIAARGGVGHGELNEPEEYDLVDKLPKSRTFYCRRVWVFADGDTKDYENSAFEGFDGIDSIAGRIHVSEINHPPARWGQPARWITIEGWDQTAVNKSYTERLARAKAELAVTP